MPARAKPTPCGDETTQQGTVTLPFLGMRLPLPAAERAAYYGAIAGLVALELIDWPVALVVVVGHEILKRSRSPVVREVGEAAETI